MVCQEKRPRDTRMMAIGNPNMPEDALREMASDEEYAIRRTVAGNPNTPVDALKKLAKDKDAGVCKAATSNPSVSEDTLWELIEIMICFLKHMA